MSYEQSVRDDVAARYGVPVTGAVQIVPRGASGIFTETPVWNGLALVYPSLKGETGQALRDAQKRAADNHARQQKFERAAKKAEAARSAKPKPPTLSEMYGERIRVLAAQGMTGAEIAADINLNVDTARTIAGKLGIRIKRAARGSAPRVRTAPKVRAYRVQAEAERRAEIRHKLDAGVSQFEIFEALLVYRRTFCRDLEALGVTPEPMPARSLNRRQVSVGVVGKVTALHAEGKINSVIAEELGVNVVTVRRALKVSGLKGHSAPSVTPEQQKRRDEIVALRLSGMSYRGIIAKLGTSTVGVAAALKAAGLAA